jgi:RHS repeat-associated protein
LGSEISKALGEGAQKLEEGLGKTMPQVFHKLYGQVHDGVTGNVERTVKKDTDTADSFTKLHPDAKASKPKGTKAVPGGGSHNGGGSGKTDTSGLTHELDDPMKHDGGSSIEHDGTKKSTTAGDPVDVASGQMLMAETDVHLPGVLPLVVRRVYASGRRAGRLLGPGWASTLDIRVLVDDDGIHFTDDDGRVLHYPIPGQPGQQVMPAEGSRWPLEWDRRFDTVSVTDPERGLTFGFTALDRSEESAAGAVRPLTALTDRNGNRIEFSSHDGLPTEMRHLGGYRISVETLYTAAGFRIAGLYLLEESGSQSSSTPLVTYDYDPRGRLIAATDAVGHAQIYEWDERDRIVAATNRNGFRYEHEYDELGRVVRGHGPDGMLSTSLAYDEERGVTTVTDSVGGTTEYQFDEYGHPVRVCDPGGGVRGYEYDRYGRQLAQTNAVGATLRLTRDEAGRPVSAQAPDGTEVRYAYDEAGRPVRITDPGGFNQSFEYDERGNLLSVADDSGAVTRYSYGERGALEAITDPSGAATRFETDRAGLVLAVIGPDGATSRCVRDAFGRQTELTAPDGSVVTFGWDALGRLLWRAEQDGAREEWVYDAMGNTLRHRDVSGAVSELSYGPFSTLISRTDRAGVTYDFDYDTELRLTEVTAPNGQTWQYRYDADGELVGETDFGGRSVTYLRDAVGRMLGRTDATGAVIEFEYDAGGRVSRQRADGAETSFAYDTLGGLTRAESPEGVLEITRDRFGRVVAETWCGRTLATEFDGAGRPLRRTTPTGAETSWTYDAHGRVVAMTGGGDSLHFEYDPAGRETTRRIGHGAALTQGFDAEGRLTGQAVWARTVPDPATPDIQHEYRALQQRTYTYGAGEVPREVTDLLRGNRGFELDPLGRVTRVTTAAGAETYSYDALGNTTAANTPADGDGDGDREYDGYLLRKAGRTHYEYDAEGRLTRVLRTTLSGQRREWTYTWNSLGLLAETTTPDGTRWRYEYDPLGRRRAKLRLDAQGEIVERTLFDWDQTCLVEQTTSAPNGEIRVLTWDYEPANYRPSAQREQIWAGTAEQPAYDQRFYAIVADLSGAPSELVTPDGRVAWHQTTSLWGAPIAAPESETDCPLRFAGQYFDAESGLHYNYHRYYDPEAGTYVSADPLGIGPKANPRTYVDNPMVQSDPLGLYDPAQLSTQTKQEWGQRDAQLAARLHESLDPRSQRYSTTSVVSAIDSHGNRVGIVSTNGEGITPPSHRDAVDRFNDHLTQSGVTDRRYEWVPNSGGHPDDVQGPHAESNAIHWMGYNGYTPVSGGASRNVCTECAITLNSMGATLFGPKTAGNGPGERMFHW